MDQNSQQLASHHNDNPRIRCGWLTNNKAVSLIKIGTVVAWLEHLRGTIYHFDYVFLVDVRETSLIKVEQGIKSVRIVMQIPSADVCVKPNLAKIDKRKNSSFVTIVTLGQFYALMGAKSLLIPRLLELTRYFLRLPNVII